MAAPDPADDDEETVDRPAGCGGRGGSPELWPPPAFGLVPGEPGVTGAEGRDGAAIGGVATVVRAVVVIGGGLTGGEGAVVVVTVGPVTPGTVTPGIVTPGTVIPGSVTPGTVTPGTVTPGTVTPGTVTPGTVTPGTDTVGAAEVGTVPALLACGTATKTDSSAPANTALIAAGRPAQPSKPLDQDLYELSISRRLT